MSEWSCNSGAISSQHGIPYDDPSITNKIDYVKIHQDIIDHTLEERGKRYGEFTGHAEITQKLKRVIRNELFKRLKDLPDDQQEALDMIAHKIGRIINGDNNYADSWVDIAGYAKLVANRLGADNDN